MPTTRLLFASHNAHKAAEVAQILDGTDVEVLPLSAVGALPEAPEDHDNFADNALQKARFIFERTGMPCVADDSGLEVRALGGAPGVHSKRFSPEGTAEANNALLLARLEGVTDRRAWFRCALAVVGPLRPGGPVVEGVVEGLCEGEIAQSPSGSGGFGYDPLFLPDETPGRSMAELRPEEKNGISHRGRAFAALPELLAQLRSVGL